MMFEDISKSEKQWRYGVIFDCGSSGSRVYIYRWLDSGYQRLHADLSVLDSLPEIKTKKKWTKKVQPGVSSFADNVEDVGPRHLDELLQHALDVVPADQVAETPLFVLATAGVRLLPKLKKEALLRQVCDYAMAETKFLLPDCTLHVQAISGETEGLYGWIATNYLLNSFDATSKHQHGKGHHTYGFLDMGGASAQIAFAPNATETEKHADDLKLLRLRKTNGKPVDYKVFVTTWLGFGVNEARTRYVEQLLEAHRGQGILEVPDPCLHDGLRLTTTGLEVDVAPGKRPVTPPSEDAPYLMGTGKFIECQSSVRPLLSKGIPCDTTPGCLLDSGHFPKIDFDVNHFLGVSEYWHTTQEVFQMGHDTKAYDLATYSQRVQEFCTSDWASIEKSANDKEWGKKVDTARASKICFKASWMMNVLHEGLGIPRFGLETTDLNHNHNTTEDLIDGAKSAGFLDPFQAVNKIQDVEVSWTLGKMVLYAASMVPLDDAYGNFGPLPVGFGSNRDFSVAGIPTDFEYASGISQITKPVPSQSFADPPTQAGNSPSGYASAPPTYTADDIDHWHSPLWNSANSTRRIPGLILFFFMMSIVVYLLLGRERRSRLYRRFRQAVPLGLVSKRHNYERVLEEGDADRTHVMNGLSPPNAFEMGDYDDDDHSSSSSGEGIGSRGGTARRGGIPNPIGLGLTSSGTTRMGSRIASREHLTSMGTLVPGGMSRSRDVSPMRGQQAGRRVKSPMPRGDLFGN